ncbi:MAG: FAD:protein FMN transferase [Myxococcota bacterium]
MTTGRARLARAVVLVVAIAAASCASSSPARHIASDGQLAMGTVLDVQLVVPASSTGRAELDAVFAQVHELDALVSHYDPASEVSRLSAASGGGPRAVDPRVAELVGESLRFATLTSGAFDVTVGRLVDVWRGKDAESVVYEDVAAARAPAGIDGLRLLADGRVELARAGVKLDFGGIAKGWALDRVQERLDAERAGPALLSFGQSSILARGAPPDDPRGWTLVVRSPADGFAARVTLRDRALSVSSSFPPSDAAAGGSGAEADALGAPSGVVDPRSGWIVTRRTLAAVASDDATTADALSTSLLVLDYEEGLALAERLEGVEALLVDEDGRIAMTSGWREATGYVELGVGFRSLSPGLRTAAPDGAR